MRKIPALAVLAFAAGTLLRVALVPLPGTRDVDAWKAWSYYATERGIGRVYGEEMPPRRHVFEFGAVRAAVNYPPLAVAELAVIGHVYRRAMGGRFPDTRALTVAIKSVILLVDVGLLLAVALAVHRAGGPEAAWWAAAAFWINPAGILTSALGYIDVWCALPAIMALVAASSGWAMAAGAWLAAGALTKPQALLVLPVVALALWHAGDRHTAQRRLSAAFAAGAVATAIVVAPVVLAGTTLNMLRAVGSMTRDTFLSGDACNLWWIVGYVVHVAEAAHEGLRLREALTVTIDVLAIRTLPAAGPIDARLAGAVLTAAAWAWALRTARGARDLARLAALGAFLVHAYFTLFAQVHENHFFLAIPLLAIAASIRRELAPVLTVLSVIFALNLYLFYGIDGAGPPPETRTLTAIDSTVLLAFANCAALGWHARALARAVSARE